MKKVATWGVIATAKAPAADILRFAAHHIEAGAARVHVFLDERNPKAFFALRDHPRCKVTVCDAAYWQRAAGERPERVEPRQSTNASRAYRMHDDLDWLIHADVDEFLVSLRPLALVLAELPEDIDTLRIRPMEALAHGEDDPPVAFKDYIPNNDARIDKTILLYPTYGAYVRSGFLSHVEGKIAVRTGLGNVKIRIHNTFRNGQFMEREVERDEVRLAHLHAVNWMDWRRALPFRLAEGSYRQGLKPNIHDEIGGVSLNDLFTVLMEEEGADGLRPFFDEVCADTPSLRARLDAQGLLVLHNLELDAKLARQFPKAKGLITSV